MKQKPKVKVTKMNKYQFRKKITPWCILFFPIVFTIWLKYYPIVKIGRASCRERVFRSV